MIGQKLHPVDAQRLADIARIVNAYRKSGHLPEGEMGGFVSVIGVLLKRHGGDSDRAAAVATHLLARASEAPPTVAALLKIAASANTFTR